MTATTGATQLGVVIPVRDLPRYVEGLPLGYDVYLSQCRFQGRRRIVNLLILNALWVDLDYFQADSALSESAALLELLCSCPEMTVRQPRQPLESRVAEHRILAPHQRPRG